MFDNYWIEEGKFEDYSKDRAEAAQKAIAAMESFCENAKLQWAGSQDGEAVVGFNAEKSIQNPYPFGSTKYKTHSLYDPSSIGGIFKIRES